MRVPDKIWARLRQCYTERRELMDRASQTQDGYIHTHQWLLYNSHKLELSRDDARRWLLMEDRGEYVEVTMIRDAQHSYKIHQELERQFAEWEKTHATD